MKLYKYTLLNANAESQYPLSIRVTEYDAIKTENGYELTTIYNEFNEPISIKSSSFVDSRDIGNVHDSYSRQLYLLEYDLEKAMDNFMHFYDTEIKYLEFKLSGLQRDIKRIHERMNELQEMGMKYFSMEQEKE